MTHSVLHYTSLSQKNKKQNRKIQIHLNCRWRIATLFNCQRHSTSLTLKIKFMQNYIFLNGQMVSFSWLAQILNQNFPQLKLRFTT